MIVRVSVWARDRMLGAIGALADGGSLEIYEGKQPAAAEGDVGRDQTLLAHIPLPIPAFGAPHFGTIGAQSIGDSPAIASGRASWARILDASRNTLLDIDIGESGAALNLTSAQLFERGPVAIKALVLRMPAK